MSSTKNWLWGSRVKLIVGITHLLVVERSSFLLLIPNEAPLQVA